jgi:beta-glucosidase
MRSVSVLKSSALGHDDLFADGEIDLVFVGDSITHNWEGARGPGSDYGGKPLAELKKRYSVLNLGFGGDRTQNVLWRLENGELDGYRAKCFMLMIGTNNGGESPHDTATGVKAILDVIARKQPQAKTILLPIFPCGATADHPWRIAKEKINVLIKGFADGDKVVWCDFNARFLNPDGTFPKGMMMDDNLHPLEPGYTIWAEAAAPLFKEICRK